MTSQQSRFKSSLIEKPASLSPTSKLQTTNDAFAITPKSVCAREYGRVCWVHAWRDWCKANAKKFTRADLAYWLENESLSRWIADQDFRPAFSDCDGVEEWWGIRFVKIGGVTCRVFDEGSRTFFEETSEFRKWMRRFDREWLKYPIRAEDADLARWLKKYSLVTEREKVVARYGEAAAASAVPVDEEYRVYKEFDTPHFHKTVRHSGELHEIGNESYFKNSSGWGAEVPRPGKPIDWEADFRWEEAGPSFQWGETKQKEFVSDNPDIDDAVRERQLGSRGSDEDGPADFTPIRPGVVDPFWGERLIAPESFWPNLKSFSENARQLVTRVNEFGKVAQHWEEILGGDGGAYLAVTDYQPSNRPSQEYRTQVKRWGLGKEFKPVPRPAQSVLELWNNKLNDEADKRLVGERSILRQDIYGNLSGFKPYEKRTTQPQPQQKELDEAMLEKYVARNQKTKAFNTAKDQFEKLGDGVDPRTVAHELVKNSPDAIPLITRYGVTTRRVGTVIGKNREAVKKMIQRKDRRIPGLVDMVVRMANDKNAVGTYVAVKLRSRPVYMYKVDVKEDHTDAELEEAIEKGWRAEADRMIGEEERRSGMSKVRLPDGTDTEWARNIRQRVHRAFQRKPTFTFTWEED